MAELNPDPLCNPNKNYDTFHDHLAKLKDKHLPYKLVKLFRHKHKGSNWGTNIEVVDGLHTEL